MIPDAPVDFVLGWNDQGARVIIFNRASEQRVGGKSPPTVEGVRTGGKLGKIQHSGDIYIVQLLPGDNRDIAWYVHDVVIGAEH